jgi:hypothetical protein
MTLADSNRPVAGENLLDRLLDYGEIVPSLLTDDERSVERINRHSRSRSLSRNSILVLRGHALRHILEKVARSARRGIARMPGCPVAT